MTLERFGNPFLDHNLSDIAGNNSDKVQRHLAAFCQWARDKGDSSPKPRLETIIREPGSL